VTAAALVSADRVAFASGARSGAWCKPLTPFARDRAFDFSLELMDGGVFTVSEHLGKPVWLSFFTTWCPPCNEEAGDIVRLAKKYGDSAVVIAVDEMEKPAKGARISRTPLFYAADRNGRDGLHLRCTRLHEFSDASLSLAER